MWIKWRASTKPNRNPIKNWGRNLGISYPKTWRRGRRPPEGRGVRSRAEGGSGSDQGGGGDQEVTAATALGEIQGMGKLAGETASPRPWSRYRASALPRVHGPPCA